MSYLIFYTGLASTPNSVGLKNLSNNEVIHEIDCSRPTGKETREKYQKYLTILKNKYQNIV